MSEADLFLDFVRRFAALQLEYTLTGSVAATMYGEPRVTHDVDVVLLLPRVLRVSSELLDRDRLQSWIARLGLEEQWELARAKGDPA